MNFIKYKFLLLLFLSVVLPGLFQAKANIDKEFNDKINENYTEIVGQYPFQERRNDIGIFYDFAWDKNNKKIIIKRDSQNLPIIRFSLFNKDIQPGVSIKKYNDIDLSQTSDEEIRKLHKQNVEAKLSFKDNQIISLKPNIYNYNDIKLANFYLEHINSIDTNKGLLEISFIANFTNKRPELNSLAKGLLGEGLYCANDSAPHPINEIKIKEYKYDIDIRIGTRTPVPAEDCYPIFFTYDNNEVKTFRQESGIGQFRQVFNFKKFPFDKQKLKISITPEVNSNQNILQVYPNTGYAAVTFLTPEKGAFLGLEEYINNISKNYLKEWTVTNTNIESEELILDNYYSPYSNKIHPFHENSINLVLDIERNSAHYVYKIIIPVFLILSVAWFVLWIPTHHLESRLTTSIVALLALIAYNFVFSDDIPKLDYLTALDKYILLSYIFCCIPTFMSIGFSRFIVRNQRMVTIVNKRLRTWLGLVYLLASIQIFSF
ncbi:hypothetical protein N9U73_02215 [Candidatus Pelagibacter bacterium]|nr:hypothetical protein [Candidatus Pelagibacter bacterium]